MDLCIDHQPAAGIDQVDSVETLTAEEEAIDSLAWAKEAGWIDEDGELTPEGQILFAEA